MLKNNANIDNLLKAIENLTSVLENETQALQSNDNKNIDKILEKKQKLSIHFEQQRNIFLEAVAMQTITLDDDIKVMLQNAFNKLNDIVQQNHFQLAKEVLFRQELIEMAAEMIKERSFGSYTQHGVMDTKASKQSPSFVTLNDRI